jgi:hypothetical protein
VTRPPGREQGADRERDRTGRLHAELSALDEDAGLLLHREDAARSIAPPIVAQ